MTAVHKAAQLAAAAKKREREVLCVWTSPFPRSVEEVLAGQLQGGVPRPSFLKDHDDDGTVEVVDPHAR